MDLVRVDLVREGLVREGLVQVDLVRVDLVRVDLVLVRPAKISTQMMVGWVKIRVQVVVVLGTLSLETHHHFLKHGIKCSAQNVNPLRVDLIPH